MKPAEQLLGAELVDQWVVKERLTRGPDATGGTFSVPYLVERASGGKTELGFCKALDLTSAVDIARINGVAVVDALRLLTDAYVFERDLVIHCADRRMSNVVRGVAAGEHLLTGPDVNPLLGSVPYIVFERADGDIRERLASSAFDDAWRLRVLHGAANGLRQLHQAGVFHQDIKPSNVMVVANAGKLGDLGRAARSDVIGAWDGQGIAGDRTYAPPELLYGEFQVDDRVRRLACDCFHLGSLAVFMYLGAGLTSLLEADLGPAFHWRVWPRDYRNVLPFVRGAFDRVLTDLESTVSNNLRADIVMIVRELADPDPLLRGNARAGNGYARYSLERYVSILDRVARRAEVALRSGSRRD